MAERRSPSQSQKQRRAGTACTYCHARKIKCDVQLRGVPCSNCVDNQPHSCAVRQRKNARRSAVQPGALPSSSTAWSDASAGAGHDGLSGDFEFADVNGRVDWSPWPTNTTVDFSNLTDLEEIFAFTDWASIPSLHHPVPDSPSRQNTILSSSSACVQFERIGFSWNRSLTTADHQFLHDQECFSLPPTKVLRQIVRDYFQFIHPNLPIIDEYRFEPLWADDNFRLEGFSYLVFRAMLFAAVHFLDAESLAIIGFASRREARLTYYRRVKLLFDFDGERDAVANAQACLLLTYYAPTHNRLRVNGGWLLNAARFARIARAETWHLMRDSIRARSLKRLWWCILFRDRILSLGLRWAPQVDSNPAFETEKYFLSFVDFEADLGKSTIHDYATQRRIISIATATCDLVCRLTPALQLLYRHETVAKRVQEAASTTQHIISAIHECLEGLAQWNERNIRIFPVPISLDDTQEAVCIFANLLFCYHSSAVFALHFHCMLIHQIVPRARELISLETCQESAFLAIGDIDRRTQELVSARLTRFLPISVSALLALPLLLQAINVAAVRGTEGEAIEARKLDVFTRILQSQRQNFDGSDFCIEILSNIVAYLQNDSKFNEWITAWRDGRDAQSVSLSGIAPKQRVAIKVNWTTLIRRQPVLYLRLLLHLDFALCNGSAPEEDDLPFELLRSTEVT